MSFSSADSLIITLRLLIAFRFYCFRYKYIHNSLKTLINSTNIHNLYHEYFFPIQLNFAYIIFASNHSHHGAKEERIKNLSINFSNLS